MASLLEPGQHPGLFHLRHSRVPVSLPTSLPEVSRVRIIAANR